MIQGTGSHVGKSYLTAGLCRLFRNMGVSVAPFKSQNMALNSYATLDGLEIGRAQAVQAKAAGIQPTVQMNPILLKPCSDRRSQVIIDGRAVESMDAAVYYSRKTEWMPVWKRALSQLRDQYELVIIEGAGSPAEINLVDRDIANMAVAREAGAPVLLVADIERGGAFAALFGTFSLLSPPERGRIRGFIINKFRGDPGLLGDGLEKLEEMTGVPVLGVIPFLDVALEEEDSVGLSEKRAGAGAVLEIAVPRLPRIANFTDLYPLELLSGVAVKYVKNPAELGKPDAVILPGSKNTISDLRWLKQRGLAERIVELAETGTPVLGLCAGFQMLGVSVSDPTGIEGEAGEIENGLGLLSIDTELEAEKRVRQISATIVGGAEVWGREAVGSVIAGYEIHAGFSTNGDDGHCSVSTGDRLVGWSSDKLAVVGTYVHGVFDNEDLLNSFLGLLAQRAGVPRIETPPVVFDERIEAIADALGQALDIDRIQEIIETAQLEAVAAHAR